MKSIHSTLTNTTLPDGELHTGCLVEIKLTNGSNQDETVYITDYHVNITYSGNTYLAGGHLLDISEQKNTSDLQISDVTISLSGVDQTYISMILNYTYIDRELIIHRVFLDDADAIVGNPIKTFMGRINAPTINDDPHAGTSIITVNASSYLADFDARPSRSTNHIHHKYYYPNDDFFKLWGQIDKEIVWGFTD